MAKSAKTSAKKDLTLLDPSELKKELASSRKEHFSLTMKHSLGELKQPHLIRASRKKIAQISTALNSASL